jgi:hypothetical protein
VRHLDFSGSLDASAVPTSRIPEFKQINQLTGDYKAYVLASEDTYVGMVYRYFRDKRMRGAILYVKHHLGTFTFGGVQFSFGLLASVSGDESSNRWDANVSGVGVAGDPTDTGRYTVYEFNKQYYKIASWKEAPLTEVRSGVISPPPVLLARLNSLVWEKVMSTLVGVVSPIGWMRITAALPVMWDFPVNWIPPRFNNYSRFEEIFPIEERNPDWREMAREAYQDLGFFSGNGIALVKDLASMKEAASSTLNTIISLGSKKVKAVSQLFLSFHYGWKLTYLDLRELRDTIATYRKIRRVRAHSTRTVGDRNYFATYIVDFDPWAQVESLLDQAVGMFDLELRPHIVWDSIPFSFVVDWFVNLGEILSGLDSFYSLTQRHSVVAASRSILCTTVVRPERIGLPPYLQGTIFCRYYNREYGNALPPSLFPSVTSKFPWNHSVEGLALIVSRK